MSFEEQSSHQSSSQQMMLPDAEMSGTSSEVVPGMFYRHQSAYKTEKADAMGRNSRVEAVSTTSLNDISQKRIYMLFLLNASYF